MTTQNRVAILDAGGQYVDLVRRAVERQAIEVDVLPLNTPRKDIEERYGAIIISGSPANTSQGPAPQPVKDIWDSPLPLLGICFGMQSMVVARGGDVARNAIREDGRIVTQVDISHPIFKQTKKNFTGLFTHGDFVKSIPSDFKVIGSHELSDGSLAYSAIAKGNQVGVQFHPEVFDDTPQGYQVFKNFLFDIAKLKADKNFKARLLERMIDNKLKAIKHLAKGRHVIAFVSGGVDSRGCAALAAKAVDSDHLHAFYIDHGFMRDEDELVIETLQAAGINVQKVNAAQDFEKAYLQTGTKKYGPLVSSDDPELKRKIIGKAFIDTQNKIIASLKLDQAMLLQGTNAADRIESGHSKGDSHTMTIKTHHNQVKEVQDLKAAGLLIEPIDDLFKDEVRELGRRLGLPEDLVMRQPFPGPGLAIRIIASKTSNNSFKPGDGQAEVQHFMDQHFKGLDATLLPIRSVVSGVMNTHIRSWLSGIPELETHS